MMAQAAKADFDPYQTSTQCARSTIPPEIDPVGVIMTRVGVN
jgi:hypothetical protein